MSVMGRRDGKVSLGRCVSEVEGFRGAWGATEGEKKVSVLGE